MTVDSAHYSIVVPIYNEEGNIRILYDRLCHVMDSVAGTWEMVTVNDGSVDQSLYLLEQLTESDARVKVVNLRATLDIK